MELRQTVFIVDDDSSICDGLCNLFESIGINAENFNSAEGFLDHWNCNKAGCLVLDVRLPGMTGLEFQDKMAQAGIELPIIFMTAHGDIPMVRKVMKAGAVEFLTKPFQQEELLYAVTQAFAIDAARRRDHAVLHSIRKRVDSLTHREREVMEMVTAGRLNKQIAAELRLSEITVKLHRRHVMEKMQVDSLAELVKLCALPASHSWLRAPFPRRSDE
jgi:FixJ family two-component response regulator